MAAAAAAATAAMGDRFSSREKEKEKEEDVPQNMEEFVAEVINRGREENRRVERTYMYRMANAKRRFKVSLHRVAAAYSY